LIAPYARFGLVEASIETFSSYLHYSVVHYSVVDQVIRYEIGICAPPAKTGADTHAMMKAPVKKRENFFWLPDGPLPENYP